MDKKALQLAARFALPPNSLGYCGHDSAPEKFKACVIHGQCDGVEDEIKKFIVLNPYLKTIATITNKSPFSYEVVESYCIGNEELNKTEPKHFEILLQNFAEQGVPPWLIDELRQRPPKVFIPTHLFQVLFVGVGRASGSVPYNIETINNCMVRWGAVKNISVEGITIELNSLAKEASGYTLTKTTETLPVIPEFIENLKQGDVVTAHWKQIIKKLTSEEIEKISYWTNRVIESLN